MNYYVRINRSVSGPVSEEELLGRIRAKTISMLDEVSTDGVHWLRLGTHPIYRGGNMSSAKDEAGGATAQALYAPASGGRGFRSDATERSGGKDDPVVATCGKLSKRIWAFFYLLVAVSALYGFMKTNFFGCRRTSVAYPGPISLPEIQPGIDDGKSLAPVAIDSIPGERDALAAEPHGRTHRKFAVIVGVGDTDKASWAAHGISASHLDAPAENVKMIYAILAGKGGFAEDDVKFLWNSNATHDAIRAAVREVASKARAGDTFVFYFSGHGGQWGDKNQTFLCTYDAGPERGKRVGYTDEELNEDFARFPKGVAVAAVLQACHSGGVMTMLDSKNGEQWNPAAFADSVTSLRKSGKGLRDGDVAPIGWITAADAIHSSWGASSGSFFTINFACSAWTGECDANGDGKASFAEAWRYAKAELAKDPEYNSFPMCSDEALCESISIPVVPRRAALSAAEAAAIAPSTPSAAENGAAVDAYLSPAESDIVSLFAQVRDSKAVAGNLKYLQIAAGIDCHLVADDTLNAYAHWKVLDSGARIREICYHAGHARFDRVVGAIACKTIVAEGKPEDQAKAMLALVVGIPKALRDSRYRIEAATAARLLKAAGVGDGDFTSPDFAVNARKIADGIAMSTLSHEMGHHLLGHLDGGYALSTNSVFGRAEEEQADLFATQVMAAAETQENRQQIFMGRFFWSLIVASSEQHGGSDEDKTHPATRRRLRNLIEADPATARELGISVEMVDKIIDAVSAILDGDGE